MDFDVSSVLPTELLVLFILGLTEGDSYHSFMSILLHGLPLWSEVAWLMLEQPWYIESCSYNGNFCMSYVERHNASTDFPLACGLPGC